MNFLINFKKNKMIILTKFSKGFLNHINLFTEDIKNLKTKQQENEKKF